MTNEVITLWPDGTPFALDNVGPEAEYPATGGLAVGTRFLRNISKPSLTVFTPETGKANGVGIIVCPGGGWRIHAWDHEGIDVGTWLAGLGYTAFILKYRVMGTPSDDEEFKAIIARMDNSLAAPLPAAKLPRRMGELISGEQYEKAREAAAQDGRRAIEVVRAQAERFGLRQDAIGMMGFSAGAFLTADICVDPQGAKLDFAAPIYGGETRGQAVPDDAPPLFIAVAQDDRLLFRITESLYLDWSEADRPVEFHLYTKGGHGFGMIRQNLPVDHWTDAFHTWLMAGGFA